ncbi:MAG: hypothetical protein ACR2IK_13280 [Chloroflexota bacterium]
MSRATGTPADAEPPRGAPPPDALVYQYDPNLSNPRDAYTRADHAHLDARGPEVAGTFVAYVEGRTVINTMWGQRVVVWRAEPGTRCLILGYWSDGTVHLKWPAILGVYRVDGRFPAWVVGVDKTATLVGGGPLLSANNPAERRAGFSARALSTAAMLLLLILFALLPQTREALGALTADLLRLLP